MSLYINEVMQKSQLLGSLAYGIDASGISTKDNRIDSKELSIFQQSANELLTFGIVSDDDYKAVFGMDTTHNKTEETQDSSTTDVTSTSASQTEKNYGNVTQKITRIKELRALIENKETQLKELQEHEPKQHTKTGRTILGGGIGAGVGTFGGLVVAGISTIIGGVATFGAATLVGAGIAYLCSKSDEEYEEKYNAQMEEYNAKVNNYKTSINSYKNEMNQILSSMSTAERYALQLSDEKDTLSAENEKLNNELHNKQKEEAFLVGYYIASQCDD